MNPTPAPTNPLQALLYAPEQATPQDYADALDQLGKQAQTGIRTPGALGSNLLADALLQYGQARARNAQQPSGIVPAGSYRNPVWSSDDMAGDLGLAKPTVTLGGGSF